MGEAIALEGSYTDPGLLDTHEVFWDLGDGTTVIDTLTPEHTYTTSGTYTVTSSVSDKDGATTSDSLAITVESLSEPPQPPQPTLEITNLAGDTVLDEGDVEEFEAIAISSVEADLTYTWNFGDGSEELIGTIFEHTFASGDCYVVVEGIDY